MSEQGDGARKARASAKVKNSTATAPDNKKGPEGADADRVAAAVGGGEAIAPGSVGGIDPARLFAGFFDLANPFKVAQETARLMGEWT